MMEGKYASVSHNEYTLNYQFLGASGEVGFSKPKTVKAETKENQITYPNSIEGIDIRNVTLDTQVKEDIIISEYKGFSEFHFFIETFLTASLLDDGSIQFADKDKQVFFIPKPFMTDSNIDPLSGEPQHSENVSYELEKVSGGYHLLVKADPEWLKNSNRIYPIYVDPTLEFFDVSSDTQTRIIMIFGRMNKAITL